MLQFNHLSRVFTIPIYMFFNDIGLWERLSNHHPCPINLRGIPPYNTTLYIQGINNVKVRHFFESVDTVDSLHLLE